MNTLHFENAGGESWSARGFDGTEYALLPWGSLRKAFALPNGCSFNDLATRIDLGIVGSIAEGRKVCLEHSDSLPFEIDVWTGKKASA